MALVRDAPAAIDLPQADCQPKQEAALVCGIGGRAGAAPHDGDSEGDVLAGGNFKPLDVDWRVRPQMTSICLRNRVAHSGNVCL